MKCNKNTEENVNSKVIEIKNGKTMLLSKCDVCNSKKPRFIKEKEAKGLLSSLGLKIPLNKIPLLCDLLF